MMYSFSFGAKICKYVVGVETSGSSRFLVKVQRSLISLSSLESSLLSLNDTKLNGSEWSPCFPCILLVLLILDGSKLSVLVAGDQDLDISDGSLID